MDNSEAASTTQLDFGDIAAAVDVPDHLESGEPKFINLALAIEALKRGDHLKSGEPNIAAATTQLDFGDTAAAVPDHLESGEPNIIALALAIHNHQEALKRGAAATSANEPNIAAATSANEPNIAAAAPEVPQEALTEKTQEALTEKTQEALIKKTLKNKTKRAADDTLVFNLLQQYS